MKCKNDENSFRGFVITFYYYFVSSLFQNIKECYWNERTSSINYTHTHIAANSLIQWEAERERNTELNWIQCMNRTLQISFSFILRDFDLFLVILFIPILKMKKKEEEEEWSSIQK